MSPRRAVAVLGSLLVVALTPVPALAADDPAPVSLQATVGASGYVRPGAPFTLSVELTATRLVAGPMRVQLGNEVFVQEVELPAGTPKTYTLQLPPPDQQRRIVLDLAEAGGAEALVTERIPLLVAADSVVVGVAGNDAIVPVIDALTTAPFNQDLTVLPFAPGDDLAPLDYLVVTDPGCCDAAAVAGWIEQGGRLVASSSVVGALGLPSTPTVTLPGTTAAIGAVERGELIVWEDIDDARGDQWRATLRSVPPATTGLDMGGVVDTSQLFEAAVASGTRASLELPWLLAAIAAYVIIAGPVNFLVLRRFGRMEWAWVTVPAIGLVAVVGFVVIGRQQAASLHVTQASLIVEGEDRVYAESGVVYFAANEGRHTIGFDRDMSARAAQGAWFASTGSATVSRTEDGGTELSFELPSLGAATAFATWRPDPSGIVLAPEVGDDGVTVQIDNRGDNTYWAWGLASGQRVIVESTPLQPGDSETLVLRPGGRVANPWESPLADSIGATIGGTERTWQVVWPLAYSANRVVSSQLGDAMYFFGFTDDPTVPLRTGGRATEAHGSALVVVDTGIDGSAAAGIVGADLVATDGQVDSSTGKAAWVYGATYVDMRFVAPAASGMLEIGMEQLGFPDAGDLQVWNWVSGAFDAVDLRDGFTADAHRSAGGEVMVRLELPGGVETPVSAYTLTWESA